MLTSNVDVLDELIADDLVWTMHTGQLVNNSLTWAHTALEFSSSRKLRLAIVKFITMVIAL
jgi:hypothetical protein